MFETNPPELEPNVLFGIFTGWLFLSCLKRTSHSLTAFSIQVSWKSSWSLPSWCSSCSWNPPWFCAKLLQRGGNAANVKLQMLLSHWAEMVAPRQAWAGHVCWKSVWKSVCRSFALYETPSCETLGILAQVTSHMKIMKPSDGKKTLCIYLYHITSYDFL